MRRLEKLRRETYEIWNEANIDLLVVPTASITPTVKEAQVISHQNAFQSIRLLTVTVE